MDMHPLIAQLVEQRTIDLISVDILRLLVWFRLKGNAFVTFAPSWGLLVKCVHWHMPSSPKHSFSPALGGCPNKAPCWPPEPFKLLFTHLSPGTVAPALLLHLLNMDRPSHTVPAHHKPWSRTRTGPWNGSWTMKAFFLKILPFNFSFLLCLVLGWSLASLFCLAQLQSVCPCPFLQLSLWLSLSPSFSHLLSLSVFLSNNP